jgi:hypothetical protein
MAETLKLLDLDTGEAHSLEDNKDDLLQLLYQREEDLHNLQRQYVKALRRIKTLEDDQEKAREESADRKTIEDIFKEWQEVAGKHRSKLGASRFDAIAALLKLGYTRQQFSQAIRGGCYDPFVTDAKNGRMICHNDIELICRDEKRFEAAALRAPKE